MSIYEKFYIVSISFQLSGALLLLLRYCFVSIEKELKEIAKREHHVENTTLILGRTQPTPYEYVETVWLNRIAFGFITAGYLIGVWGAVENTKRSSVFLWIVCLSAILTIAALIVSKRLSAAKKEE